MISRIAAFVGLLSLIAGGFLDAGQMAVAQAQSADAAANQPASPAKPASDQPALSVRPSAAPAQTAAPPAQALAFVKAPLPRAKPTLAVATPLPRPKPALRLEEKEKGIAASLLFGAKKLPSVGKPLVIGYYSHGCLQGGIELPINGPHWEVMRLSRNRNWGHPKLIDFIKRFSAAAAKATGRPGILIGDMAQPRGGPLAFGHTSHQVGLDVDIWYMPMPDRILTKEERENITATRVIAENDLAVNQNWTPADAIFLRTVAEQPDVERVLVNAAVKKKMCELEGKHHYAWMAKLRPWYFHRSHFHVRLKCPADSPHCRHQPPVPAGDGCGKKDMAFWFSKKTLNVKPETPRQKLEKPLTMAGLPAACQQVLNAPAKNSNLAADAK